MPRGGGFHSRLVGVLKIGLPLLALALLASLFVFPREERRRGGIVFSESDLEAFGAGLRINRPVLTGATRDDDPFRFTAVSIVPDAAPPTRAEADALAGWIEFVGGQRLDVEAPLAAFDFETQIMQASGRVTVRSSDGQRITADRVVLDLVAGILEAEGAVDGAGPMGTINAETLLIVPAEARGGHRIFSFGGGVRLFYGGGGSDGEP
jgi:lipopolysaccharide export system protein LptC